MKLSVITINLNNAPGLEKTIQSFAGQAFSDAELIVIDGGSTDGSKQVIDKYSKEISYSISEKDSGIYHAQNKGLMQAKGEYCLFLNSGDYLAGNNVLARVFSRERAEDILYGDMIIERKDGTRYKGKMPEIISFHHMIRDTLWHPVSFIRRKLFQEYGYYDETLKMVADYDFFLKTIIVHKVSTFYLQFPVAVFNLHGFSSDPGNRKIMFGERRDVQLRYFAPAVIASAEKLNRILGSRWFRILHRLKIVNA